MGPSVFGITQQWTGVSLATIYRQFNKLPLSIKHVATLNFCTDWTPYGIESLMEALKLMVSVVQERISVDK
jgi:hypothetical protein